ncbi:MCE family protein [Nocardia sp. NPDC005978]|uniref:MCE family protein n=1 Tax=Nocardia sp. NPDC005978 TaxID=3156725 RepID=UPI0033B2EC66
MVGTQNETAPGQLAVSVAPKPRAKRASEQGWVIKLAGVGLVLGLVGLVVLSLVSFAGGFTNTAEVTVASPRSGLVLDPDAKVKIRGVEIGKVAGIETVGDGARITLALDPEQLKLVPANAVVDIRSTTIFGAKYINFVAPENASKESLKPGATVAAADVTVEFNTIFQKLSDVLAMAQPEKLNATLLALGSALEGRGDKLGTMLADGDTFLKDINPSLPTLQEDLRKTASVAGTYADTVPDLLRTTDNLIVTGDTLVSQKSKVDDLLVNLIGLADTSGATLGESENDLIKSLQLLTPTTGLLNEYRTGLACVIDGLGSNIDLMNRVMGGNFPGFGMNASIMPGGTPYQYPEDLPKVNATGGPHCENIMDRPSPQTRAKYLVTDTAEGHIWMPPTEGIHLNKTVFEVLFAGVPGVTQ